ncbi:unnamed protein product [Lampetra fluviatilis]
MWALSVFHDRPRLLYGDGEAVFGVAPWLTLLHLCQPLAIFYRMHSVASLAHVYRHA